MSSKTAANWTCGLSVHECTHGSICVCAHTCVRVCVYLGGAILLLAELSQGYGKKITPRK